MTYVCFTPNYVEWLNKLRSKEKLLYNPHTLRNIALCKIVNSYSWKELNYIKQFNYFPVDDTKDIFNITVLEGRYPLKSTDKKYWLYDYKCTEFKVIFTPFNLLEDKHISCSLIQNDGI
jgi:hypothetical protein